jgi:hypothetical protein
MKTAVDWFLEELENNDWYWLPESIKNEIINQAKEIEKKNLYECASFWRGKENKIEKPFFDQWYNENFKSDEQE